ncbi:hypothetical protein CBOM_07064 [Ceraceosorus bombacis]|uniref:Uncharacterized protein n=1 Tax=Ceraceosorus bombacis TaxID=401625 RepID=A0A0N7L357_9BASI|nr:hypothetical protein CBOM_07064 [Ceraceosorus bombacis]
MLAWRKSDGGRFTARTSEEFQGESQPPRTRRRAIWDAWEFSLLTQSLWFC